MSTKLQSEYNPALSAQTEFLVNCISAFARKLNMRRVYAYPYLRNYRGIEFLLTQYTQLQVRPIEEIIYELIKVCKQNGGKVE